MSEAVFQTKITAKDDTGKGVKSAEKTIGQLPRQAAVHGKRAMSEMDSAVTKSGRGILSTFTKMERASASAIGGGSGGIIGRLSSVASVATSAGSGLGEAAAGAGLLEGAMGALAGAGAIAAGVIAGVVLGADKLIGSWSKGVLGAANLAATIGVTTKALQEFQAAGERVGVDKGASGGAMAGLSQTLNDARYGRNSGALAVLGRTGVGMKLNSDGTVDVATMAPLIADAMKRQTSSGARTMGGALGIGQAAFPMFMQGGAALSADMADAGAHANVATLGEIQSARKWTRQRARLGQMAERVGDRAGAFAADHAQGMLDHAVDFGGSTIDTGGMNIVRGAEEFGRSVENRFKPAVDHFASALMGGAVGGWAGGGKFDRAKVNRMAIGALPIYQKLRAHGDSPEKAAAWAASAFAESGGDPHRQQPGKGRNLGYGLFQWDAARRATFQRVIGRDIHGSSFEDQVKFRDYELSQKGELRAGRAISAASGPGASADAITRFYERPKAVSQDAADRTNVAQAIAQAAGGVRHDVHVHLHDERRNTRVSVTSSRRDGPKVSHAVVRGHD